MYLCVSKQECCKHQILLRNAVPSSEVSHHFAQDIGLTLVLPLLKEVVINTDGKQDVFAFAVFALECAFDLALDRAALEGMLRTHDDELIVEFDTAVDFSPHRFAPDGIFRKVPGAYALSLQVGV